MKRNVQIVLLCEDTQHETFVRRFLAKAGWSMHRLRVLKAPRGRGSAEQWVKTRFPTELAAYRRRRVVAQALIIILDGDNRGVQTRQAELDAACRLHNIDIRTPDERVMVLVPTWNIETWIAYLTGQTVDETTRDYPRLARPRECQAGVGALIAMCQDSGLRQPAPSSLAAACVEYARLVD